MFLEISQNSQENTCARVSFLIKLQASDLWHVSLFCMKINDKAHYIETNLLFILALSLGLKNVVYTLRTRRGSHPDVPYQKAIQKNVTKLTGNHLQWSPCCRPPFCNITKKRLYRRYFPTNFVKNSGVVFLQNIFKQVLP